MCVNVSGFLPVKRGPEQCLCIAVPIELGPSRDLVSSSRASPDAHSPEGSQLHSREEEQVRKKDPGNLAEEVEGGCSPYPKKREIWYPGLPQPTDTPYNSLFPVQTSSAGRAG